MWQKLCNPSVVETTSISLLSASAHGQSTLPQGGALKDFLESPKHPHLQLCVALGCVLLCNSPTAILNCSQHADLQAPQLGGPLELVH